jgi:hypothetical protein
LNPEPAARLCSSADKRRSQDAPRRGGDHRSICAFIVPNV